MKALPAARAARGQRPKTGPGLGLPGAPEEEEDEGKGETHPHKPPNPPRRPAGSVRPGQNLAEPGGFGEEISLKAPAVPPAPLSPRGVGGSPREPAEVTASQAV